MRVSRLFFLLMVLLVTPGFSFGATSKSSSIKTKAVSASTSTSTIKKSETVKSETSTWSGSVSYGVTTDLADRSSPRLYYQGLGGSLGYAITPRWTFSIGLDASFTTVDGQIDKKQEESALESSGLNPSMSLAYSPGSKTPWFASLSGSALLDSASRREGYLALFTGSAGGTWGLFDDLWSMTHSFYISELVNSYEYSSQETPNPGTAVSYNFGNTFHFGSAFAIGASFGLKQTRYLDGYWDYSYTTDLSASYTKNGWSVSLSTSNGGYTDDGRVSLWYVDQYRRLVSLSLSYVF